SLDCATPDAARNLLTMVPQTPPSPVPYRGTWYTVAARRPVGDYEGALAGAAVIIHRVGSDYRSVAESQDADWPPADVANNEGSMFKPGESWVSPDGLFSVYVESATATGFVVVVAPDPKLTGGPGPRRRKQ